MLTGVLYRYHLDLCKSLFGKGVYPEVDATNLYYGGDKIAATKIVFTNGSQDPWRHASKQTSSPDCKHPFTFRQIFSVKKFNKDNV